MEIQQQPMGQVPPVQTPPTPSHTKTWLIGGIVLLVILVIVGAGYAAMR